MPKRNIHRRKTLRGGFSLSDSWNNFTQGASNMFGKAKTSVGLSSSSSSTNPTTNYSSTPSNVSNNVSYGGKSRRRRMRGGIKGYTPTTGLAAHGASFSGPTAKPHTMVGGKTRKRRKHKHSKSCKH
jgi:hypothetical protein